MKAMFETTMATAGEKMGIESIAETAHCMIAFAGIALAIAFVFVALAM